ncbi:MAG: hypothetical protein ABSH01_24560, partial [Terriglobia bacterium]
DGGTTCACSRRRSLREPDAGNPHVRFDEGRGALSATSPTLPPAGVADINSDVGVTRESGRPGQPSGIAQAWTVSSGLYPNLAASLAGVAVSDE